MKLQAAWRPLAPNDAGKWPPPNRSSRPRKYHVAKHREIQSSSHLPFCLSHSCPHHHWVITLHLLVNLNVILWSIVSETTRFAQPIHVCLSEATYRLCHHHIQVQQEVFCYFFESIRCVESHFSAQIRFIVPFHGSWPFPNLFCLASKIKVDKPIAELDGDEMTRIIWHKIRCEVRRAKFHGILLLRASSSSSGVWCSHVTCAP